MVGFVYHWTNTINNRWYIGSTNGKSKSYKGSGTIFKKAVKKHGIENFVREILYEGDDYKNQEEYFLDLYDAVNDPMSYNMTNKCSGGTTGIPKTQEHRDKISDALSGRPSPHKGKKQPNKGRPHDETWRKNHSDSLKGKPHSQERIDQRAASNTGKKRTDAQKDKLRGPKSKETRENMQKSALNRKKKDKKEEADD